MKAWANAAGFQVILLALGMLLVVDLLELEGAKSGAALLKSQSASSFNKSEIGS